MSYRWLYGVLVLLISLPGWGQSSSAVATFSSIVGDVAVLRADGKQITATLRTQLYLNDRVEVRRNSKAVVLFYSGKEVQAPGSKSLRINSEDGSKSVLTSISKMLQQAIWGKEKSRQVAGATRYIDPQNHSQIYIRYPVETKVKSPRPAISWVDPQFQAGQEYQVAIESSVSGYKYQFSVFGDTMTDFPADAPSLTSNDFYIVQVSTRPGRTSIPGHFSIIHPDELGFLDTDMASLRQLCDGDTLSPRYDLLCAALYWDYGLMQDAEKAMLRYISKKPDTPYLHWMLSNLYRAMGRNQASTRHKKIGDQLAGLE